MNSFHPFVSITFVLTTELQWLLPFMAEQNSKVILLVQSRVLRAAGGRALGGRRPLAAAALQHVDAGGPGALLALEVEEDVLIEGEPLLVPAVGLGRPLAQARSAAGSLPLPGGDAEPARDDGSERG